MSNLFSTVLNMSMTGSVVILLVMLARLILKRSPKIFSYALWSVVLFRLLCPVAFTASVSVLNALEPEVQEASESTSVVYFLPAEVNQNPELTFVPAEKQSVTESVQAGEPEHTRFDLMTVASYVWITGSGIMILYSVIQYIRLRLKLVGAIAYRGNVYRADYIDTPFVMGILSPKIYLPSNVPANERKFIIAHERHHIHRCDHIIKLLAYFALCIHWFNPLVWAAFILAGKDMEMSCDEAVIRKMGSQIRADYSASLLRLATHKKIIAGMPLAFGEGDTKGRVMNMAKWKKPKLWVSMICLLLCAVVLVACAVNPSTQEETYMPTVAPEGKAANGVVTRIPFTIGQLPDGYEYEVDIFGDILFTDGTNIVGGITCYPIPEGIYDPDDDIFLWLEKVGIPDFEDTSLCYMGGMSTWDNGWIAEFASDVPEGVAHTVERRHHFYPIGDRVYDIWFDMLLVSYETSEDLRTAVDRSESVTQTDTNGEHIPVEGNDIVSDTQMVQYGSLKMLLGPGFATREQDGSIVITKDSADVGGIICYSAPDFPLEKPGNMSDWISALGLPESRMELDGPIAQMIGDSLHGDLETEFFFEMDPSKLNSEHHFYIDGNIVYDVYYDQNLINDSNAVAFLNTVTFENTVEGSGESVISEEAFDAEAEAYEKCNAIFEAVQNGYFHILSEQKDEGYEGPSGYSREYYSNDSDKLSVHTVLTEGENITEAGDYLNRHAYMWIEDQFFSNEGYQGESGDIVWVEREQPMDYSGPWLESFVWNKTYVAYVDTLTDENGSCMMFRVDKMYEDREDYAQHYFANFYFDPDGNFIQVSLQVNAFMDNEFTVTESIVSLDAEEINAEIQAEYQNAIG